MDITRDQCGEQRHGADQDEGHDRKLLERFVDEHGVPLECGGQEHDGGHPDTPWRHDADHATREGGISRSPVPCS